MLALKEKTLDGLSIKPGIEPCTAGRILPVIKYVRPVHIPS